MGLLLLACLACRKTAAERAQEEQLAKDNAAQAEKDQAELEARFRRECKVKDGGVVFPIYDDDLVSRCHAEISASVKVPGSEDFPSDDLHPHMVSDDGCNRIFNSSFTAQNAFGVKVRTNYSCTYDPRTSRIKFSTQ